MAQRTDPQLVDTAGLCRRNALHVVRLAWKTQPQVGFDAQGVRWLDRYVGASSSHLTDDLLDEFVHLMGCFYGECLIAEFGATWSYSGEELGVYADPLGYTYPFRAVARRVSVGPRASIAVAFATAVEYVSMAA